MSLVESNLLEAKRSSYALSALQHQTLVPVALCIICTLPVVCGSHNVDFRHCCKHHLGWEQYCLSAVILNAHVSVWQKFRAEQIHIHANWNGSENDLVLVQLPKSVHLKDRTVVMNPNASVDSVHNALAQPNVLRPDDVKSGIDYAMPPAEDELEVDNVLATDNAMRQGDCSAPGGDNVRRSGDVMGADDVAVLRVRPIGNNWDMTCQEGVGQLRCDEMEAMRLGELQCRHKVPAFQCSHRVPEFVVC